MINLLAVVILFSGMLFTSVVKAVDIDLSNWMDKLDGETLITRISIPGTHDSAAIESRCGTISVYCHTQTYGFTDQLSRGIRFFDIRLAYEDDDLKFHHSIYDLDINFKDAVNTVKDFLNHNYNEFVIFLIKQEHTSKSTDTFWERINYQLGSYKDDLFYFSQNGVPTVDEVRGKIVIMAREKPSDYPGSDPYHVEWDNNTHHDEGSDGHLKYVVEDNWHLDVAQEDNKFARIVQNLYLAGLCAHSCSNPETLFITFLSANGAGLSGRTPTHYADYENPRVADWLEDCRTEGSRHYGPRPGIVAMDFGGSSKHHGDDVVEQVIRMNPYYFPK